MAITQLHHVSILVADTQRALAFYCGILGLERDSNRPDLGYPGAWLKIGAGQQLHLLQLPNPEAGLERPAHGGRDRHFALCCDDLDAIIHNLQRAGIAFSRSQSGRQAVFCRDPDGNAVEIIRNSC